MTSNFHSKHNCRIEKFRAWDSYAWNDVMRLQNLLRFLVGVKKKLKKKQCMQ